jgi:hypothetical protein
MVKWVYTFVFFKTVMHVSLYCLLYLDFKPYTWAFPRWIDTPCLDSWELLRQWYSVHFSFEMYKIYSRIERKLAIFNIHNDLTSDIATLESDTFAITNNSRKVWNWASLFLLQRNK